MRKLPPLVLAAALGLVLSRHPLTAQTSPDPFAALIAAERDFATDAQRIGITPAFRAHAASDSVLLASEPVAALDHLATQVDTPGLTLEWGPAMAGLARSADLGFTTGPYRMVKGERVLAGRFLTIWTRGTDARWRWFLDHGLPPRPASGAAAFPSDVIRFADSAPDDHPAGKGSELATVDRDLNAAYLARGDGGVLPMLAGDGYLLRQAQGAIARVDAEKLAPDSARFARSEQLGRRVSAAGDLATSYGRFYPAEGAAAYYVRIWRRGAKGWELLIDEVA